MERWVTVCGTPLSRGTAPAYVERLARWAYGRGESDIYALQAMGEIEARIIDAGLMDPEECDAIEVRAMGATRA